MAAFASLTGGAVAPDGGPGRLLETIVTFLELPLPVSAERSRIRREGLTADAADDLTPAAYRRLIGCIGRDWHWVDVARAEDAMLAARLAEPDRSIHLLKADGSVLGLFELVRLDALWVELQYLGLLPEAIGRGFGHSLLEWAIVTAQATGARWLLARTCTLDHPAALPLYLRSGFRIVGYQRDEVLPLSPDEIARL